METAAKGGLVTPTGSRGFISEQSYRRASTPLTKTTSFQPFSQLCLVSLSLCICSPCVSRFSKSRLQLRTVSIKTLLVYPCFVPEPARKMQPYLDKATDGPEQRKQQ
ncbi:hypothetical protein AOLI_G00096060 [Acnodon oligacanthus]